MDIKNSVITIENVNNSFDLDNLKELYDIEVIDYHVNRINMSYGKEYKFKIVGYDHNNNEMHINTTLLEIEIERFLTYSVFGNELDMYNYAKNNYFIDKDNDMIYYDSMLVYLAEHDFNTQA